MVPSSARLAPLPFVVAVGPRLDLRDVGVERRGTGTKREMVVRRLGDASSPTTRNACVACPEGTSTREKRTARGRTSSSSSSSSSRVQNAPPSLARHSPTRAGCSPPPPHQSRCLPPPPQSRKPTRMKSGQERAGMEAATRDARARPTRARVRSERAGANGDSTSVRPPQPPDHASRFCAIPIHIRRHRIPPRLCRVRDPGPGLGTGALTVLTPPSVQWGPFLPVVHQGRCCFPHRRRHCHCRHPRESRDICRACRSAQHLVAGSRNRRR